MHISCFFQVANVAPLAGAWIEISTLIIVPYPKKSLPSRERGLKSLGDLESVNVEQSLPSRERGLKCLDKHSRSLVEQSLPSRERGLKSLGDLESVNVEQVAPLAGAWIEIDVFEL